MAIDCARTFHDGQEIKATRKELVDNFIRVAEKRFGYKEEVIYGYKFNKRER
jgi:hypothetical protein